MEGLATFVCDDYFPVEEVDDSKGVSWSAPASSGGHPFGPSNNTTTTTTTATATARTHGAASLFGSAASPPGGWDEWLNLGTPFLGRLGGWLASLEMFVVDPRTAPLLRKKYFFSFLLRWAPQLEPSDAVLQRCQLLTYCMRGYSLDALPLISSAKQSIRGEKKTSAVEKSPVEPSAGDNSRRRSGSKSGESGNDIVGSTIHLAKSTVSPAILYPFLEPSFKDIFSEPCWLALDKIESDGARFFNFYFLSATMLFLQLQLQSVLKIPENGSSNIGAVEGYSASASAVFIGSDSGVADAGVLSSGSTPSLFYFFGWLAQQVLLGLLLVLGGLYRTAMETAYGRILLSSSFTPAEDSMIGALASNAAWRARVEVALLIIFASLFLAWLLIELRYRQYTNAMEMLAQRSMQYYAARQDTHRDAHVALPPAASLSSHSMSTKPAPHEKSDHQPQRYEVIDAAVAPPSMEEMQSRTLAPLQCDLSTCSTSSMAVLAKVSAAVFEREEPMQLSSLLAAKIKEGGEFLPETSANPPPFFFQTPLRRKNTAAPLQQQELSRLAEVDSGDPADQMLTPVLETFHALRTADPFAADETARPSSTEMSPTSPVRERSETARSNKWRDSISCQTHRTVESCFSATRAFMDDEVLPSSTAPT